MRSSRVVVRYRIVGRWKKEPTTCHTKNLLALKQQGAETEIVLYKEFLFPAEPPKPTPQPTAVAQITVPTPSPNLYEHHPTIRLRSPAETIVLPLDGSTILASKTVVTVAAGQTTLASGAAAIIDGYLVAFESGHIVIDGRTTEYFGSGATSKLEANFLLLKSSRPIGAAKSAHLQLLTEQSYIWARQRHIIEFQPDKLTVDGSKTVEFTALASAFPSVATLSITPSLTLSAFETVITGSDGHTTEEAIIGSETLFAGGPQITLDGEVISLASDGNLVVNGTETIEFSPARNSATSSVTSGNEIKATSSFVHPATTGTSIGSPIGKFPGYSLLIAYLAISISIML
ncbi:uncharacterized protein MYCFIDRAFT_178868 [Pseudocercospora fijiensis CIRAD86]|uniref:Uncharacterized protein n=1 Tax=Pseudocercospora fijiensis (strain CIRAD86) TaxID=383855 RepID=M3A2V7_PSEFD|nr:uncharacterized protein MYCFIDRAFT_178868 [Pseudocercospora fijiensis CIRAD86]EME78761.1 hypothetical protein MYCFIDRAFT_178868 [Pseudocercospora fijiensis CIRAD86]